jgi:hypothetical protein
MVPSDRLVDAELERDVTVGVILPHARGRDGVGSVDRAARPATKASPPLNEVYPSARARLPTSWSSSRRSPTRALPANIRPAANHASTGVSPRRAIGLSRPGLPQDSTATRRRATPARAGSAFTRPETRRASAWRWPVIGEPGGRDRGGALNRGERSGRCAEENAPENSEAPIDD